VSRHHILPPAVYSPPPPKPKETRRKRAVGTTAARESDEAGETEETSEASRTAHSRRASVPQHQLPVESAERRIPSPNGKLSDVTLKAMLEAQERDGAEDAGSS